MRSPRALLFPLACAALLTGACASSRVPPHPGLDAMWHDYADLPAPRALAVAGDPNRAWVGAAAGGAASREDAEREALEECARRRHARRMQAPCRLYATGTEIVWGSH